MKVNNMFAIYEGKKYRCGTSKGGKQVDLYSDSQIEGFYDILNIGVFMCSVPRSKCERVWGQQLTFNYKGQNYNVGDKKDGKVFLRTGARWYDLKALGFDVIGHGEYGKWVLETDGEEEWVITEY